MKAVNYCTEFENFPDSQLLAAMSENDNAHSCVYERHKKYCINFMLSKGAEEDAAMDIYQDATIVLYEKVRNPEFKLTCSIQTYLNSICYNQMRARKKGSYETKTVLTDDVDENINDWFEEENESDNLKIEKILKELGHMKERADKCHERLRLFYYESLSMADIAKRLGFSNADSAKAQIDKCRSALKKILAA
jgi:RNA polymerase sigma factor (sigma-70 family)